LEVFESKEIVSLLQRGQYLGVWGVRTPDGKQALAAAIFDDEYPGSNIIKITDEKLLVKLKALKGQVDTRTNLPVFYYEYLEVFRNRL
jgi:hypothetical protein